MPDRSPDPGLSRLDHPDRTFQIWAYTVSMARLLLRSTKGDGAPTRIDVLFQAVRAVRLPTRLDGLVVAEVTEPAEVRRVHAAAGLDGDRFPGRVYAVTGRHYEGYVVAGVLVAVEDDGEFHEPSTVWPPFPPV